MAATRRRHSVHAVGVLLAGFIVAVLATLWTQRSLLSAQQSASQVINLSGRQRMLSQQVTRLALQWRREREVDVAAAARRLADINRTMALFEQVRHALMFGDTDRGIPACPDEAARGKLLAVGRAWQALRAELPPASNLAGSEDIAALVRAGDQALDVSNESVQYFQTYYEDRVKAVLMLQALSLLGGALLGTLLLTRFVRTASQGRQLHEALGRRVAERTADLKAANGQLQAAAEQAEELARAAQESSRAKDAFLANMSHEIRTPMTAILGFADALLTDELDAPERTAALHTIHRNGDYLLEIINDILDLSKIEAGKLVVERISCDPIKLVWDLASLMSVRAEAKQLDLEVAFVGPIPETIETDPTRLRQILINLIGNGVKFTEKGNIRLEVRLLDPDGGSPRLAFRVADTGIGMSAEQIAHVFDPFTQADASTTRKFGGTGLGLAISSRLAALLDGDIDVESIPGVGSAFRLTIPVGSLDGVKMVEPPAGSAAAEEKVDHPALPPSTDRLDYRILVAEDCEDNKRLIDLVLRKAGARVTLVANGRAALNQALAASNGRRVGDPREPFDVILMDMQMPVMDGYEATRRLRREGYTGPVIALTAHAMTGDREQCRQAGCDEYLTKPIDPRRLVRAVSSVVTAHRAGVRATEQEVPTASEPNRVLLRSDA